MLPKGWKITTLGNICEGNLQTGPFGSQLHAAEYQEIGIAVVMPKDLIANQVNIKTSAKISPEKSIELKKHYLQEGDIIFSRRGDVARFAIIDILSAKSICGTGCLRARPSKNHNPNFLSYFLQKKETQKWLEQNAVGQTMPNLNTTILSELPLITASSEKEEAKIAMILTTWDQAIDTIQQLITNSKDRKKSLMQQLLTGKKRLSGFGDKWQKYRLGDVFTERTETNRLDLRLLSITGDRGVIYRDDVGRKDSSSEDKSNYKRLCPNDIGYNTMRMWQGVSALSDKEGIVSPAYTILVPGKKAHPLFMSYFFKLPITIHTFYRFSQGLVSDTWNLKYTHFKQIKVTIPSYKEQEKIANVLQTADLEIQNLQAQLEKLKQEKTALMQQLLTGKRRVKV